MAMPVNMILVIYVILCILSYDFNKLTMLYIHVHISSSMTNKSGLTFFLSIKYLSVCLYKWFTLSVQRLTSDAESDVCRRQIPDIVDYLHASEKEIHLRIKPT